MLNLNEKELEYFSLNSWYILFEKIAIPTKSLEIPENVLNYLRNEIIILPKECYGRENNETVDDDDDSEILEIPEFPIFSNLLKEIIEEFKNEAFIKTNWHCPKDASWITAGQTLKVRDITDAYQLLKASSFIKQDLSSTFHKHYINLKEWYEIHPGTEFRCFVKERNLIAITPRDWPEYHKYIVNEKYNIVNDILTIFKENIQYNFPTENFVFDVIRDTKDSVLIVDFSPFDQNYTESLAFEWDELNSKDIVKDEYPEFRYLANDCGIQPKRKNNYGIPIDIINFFTELDINPK